MYLYARMYVRSFTTTARTRRRKEPTCASRRLMPGVGGDDRSKKHVNSRDRCRAVTRLLSRRNIYRATLDICMQTRSRPIFPPRRPPLWRLFFFRVSFLGTAYSASLLVFICRRGGYTISTLREKRRNEASRRQQHR